MRRVQRFWNREDLSAVGRQRIASFYGNYESRESSRKLSSRTDRLGFGIGADQSDIRQLSPGNGEDCIRYHAQLDRLLLSYLDTDMVTITITHTTTGLGDQVARLPEQARPRKPPPMVPKLLVLVLAFNRAPLNFS